MVKKNFVPNLALTVVLFLYGMFVRHSLTAIDATWFFPAAMLVFTLMDLRRDNEHRKRCLI